MENDILKKKIEFLVEAYYNNFDFLRVEPLDSLKNKAVEKYLDSGLSFEQIQEKIEDEVIQRRKNSTSNVKEEEIDEDEKISKNHQDLYDTLEELAYLLRLADVNYYIEGGLVGYLKYNEESNRVHNNINVTVEEKDYDKFKSICNTLGIEVIENPSEVHEELNDNTIKIYLSSFKKMEDGSIVNKRYDENGNVEETIVNSKLADMVYGKENTEYRGYMLNVVLPEYVYYLKSNSSLDKDKIDIEFLKDKIDKSKLDLVEELSKIEVNTNTNEALDSMMNDEVAENTNEAIEKEKPKVFEKKDNSNNENGYANTASLSGMNIIALVLTIICLIVMYILIK